MTRGQELWLLVVIAALWATPAGAMTTRDVGVVLRVETPGSSSGRGDGWPEHVNGSPAICFMHLCRGLLRPPVICPVEQRVPSDLKARGCEERRPDYRFMTPPGENGER